MAIAPHSNLVFLLAIETIFLFAAIHVQQDLSSNHSIKKHQNGSTPKYQGVEHETTPLIVSAH
jgi:hypothetical protein